MRDRYLFKQDGCCNTWHERFAVLKEQDFLLHKAAEAAGTGSSGARATTACLVGPAEAAQLRSQLGVPGKPRRCRILVSAQLKRSHHYFGSRLLVVERASGRELLSLQLAQPSWGSGPQLVEAELCPSVQLQAGQGLARGCYCGCSAEGVELEVRLEVRAYERSKGGGLAGGGGGQGGAHHSGRECVRLQRLTLGTSGGASHDVRYMAEHHRQQVKGIERTMAQSVRVAERHKVRARAPAQRAPPLRYDTSTVRYDTIRPREANSNPARLARLAHSPDPFAAFPAVAAQLRRGRLQKACAWVWAKKSSSITPLAPRALLASVPCASCLCLCRRRRSTSASPRAATRARPWSSSS